MGDVVTIRTMEELRTLAARGAERFLGEIRVPHLVFPEGFDPTRSGFRTLSGSSSFIGEPLALPVQKAGSLFSFMVTLGRAKNTDIVAPDPRVSKFHCYLRQVGDSWTIADAGSRNGTQVDGIALAKERAVPLRSGARLSFGGCPAIFLAPADLHRRMAAEAAVQGRRPGAPR